MKRSIMRLIGLLAPTSRNWEQRMGAMVSASTSEIMAAGLREAGRARIFGERSAGAAMPSAFKTLPTGDLFQYAIGDVTTPKARAIEGEGVKPDVVVAPAPADLAAGRDPALDAARAWVSRERGTR